MVGGHGRMDANPPSLTSFRAQAGSRRAENDRVIAALRVRVATGKPLPVTGGSNRIISEGLAIAARIIKAQSEAVASSTARTQAMTKLVIDLLA